MVKCPVQEHGREMPGREDSIARKPLQRFKRLAGSLEALISSIAQDWVAAADAPVGGDGGLALIEEGDDATKPIHGKMRKAQLLFTELHSTTRKAHCVIENIRNKVATAKQSMDLNHLQLENLLYERNHLARETQLCKDFTMSELSKMEEAEEQGFLEDVDILQTPEEHAENLAILKDQKEQRTNAQLELKAAQIRVKAASSSLSEVTEYLDKLPEHVKEVKKALLPLKKNMPWRPGTRRGRHEHAAELPGPLFTLYCQLEAYCDSVLAEASTEEDGGAASSSSVAYAGGGGGEHNPAAAATVSLVPAKVYLSPAAKAASQGPSDASDSAEVPGAAPKTPSASPKTSPEPEGKRQRRHYDQEGAGSGMSVQVGDEKRKISRREAGKCTLEALKPSRMEVLLTLTLDGDAPSDVKAAGVTTTKTFSVRFSYLPALGIVAVCPQSGSSPGILANLFPDDTGKTTPNPANHHSKAACASPLGIFEYPSDVPCRPYRWAQWLAGLHFPPPATALAPAGGAAGGAAADALPIEPSMRSVVAALRSRARTRLALDGQLKAFAAGKGPSPLPGSKNDNLPEVTGEVGLRSWKELSGSEKQQAAASFQERDASMSGSSAQGEEGEEEGEAAEAAAGPSTPCREDCPWERFGARYFTGTLKTNKGQGKERTVNIQVEVPAEYPLRPSLVSLAGEKSGVEPAGEAALKEDLAAVANEVNAHYDTLLTEDVSRWDHLLSHQLILVMECLTTNGGGALGRLRRGRMRRKPVVFDRLERTFVHR